MKGFMVGVDGTLEASTVVAKEWRLLSKCPDFNIYQAPSPAAPLNFQTGHHSRIVYHPCFIETSLPALDLKRKMDVKEEKGERTPLLPIPSPTKDPEPESEYSSSSEYEQEHDGESDSKDEDEDTGDYS
jgi:hypothetical protein